MSRALSAVFTPAQTAEKAGPQGARTGRQGWRSALFIASAVLLLACSPSEAASTVGSAAGKSDLGCRDLFVASMTSVHPVSGAFACLDAGLQATAAKGGVKNDKDLATNAATPPLYTATHLLGKGPSGAYEYQIQIEGVPGFLYVWLDADGKVGSVHVMVR